MHYFLIVTWACLEPDFMGPFTTLDDAARAFMDHRKTHGIEDALRIETLPIGCEPEFSQCVP